MRGMGLEHRVTHLHGPGGLEGFGFGLWRKLQWQQPSHAPCRHVPQRLHPVLHKLSVPLHKGSHVATGLRLRPELIDPQTGHLLHAGLTGTPRTMVARPLLPALPVGLEHAFDQRRRQGGRRDQQASAQQSDPVHQPRQGGHVVQVEIVEFVEHHVAAEQAQHGRDLVPRTLGLGGRHEVVDGADQHGRGQQVANAPVLQGDAQQPVVPREFVGALIEDFGIRIDQALGGGRPGALGLLFVVLEQGPAGCTADAHGQIFVTQAQIVPVAAPGLQGQGAQPQGKGAAHAFLRVSERMHDAGIGQRFAAAGGSHVDAESPAQTSGLPQARCPVGGQILPVEPPCPTAPTQQRAAQMAQIAGKVRQRMADASRITGHAQQVLVEGLVEPSLSIGVRMGTAACVALEPLGGRPLQTRIVMVCQHERQPGQMHDIGVVEPAALVGARAQCLQPARQPGGTCLPLRQMHRQAVRARPVGRDILRGRLGRRPFVPSRGHVIQPMAQPLDGIDRQPAAHARWPARVVDRRHNRQPVMGDDQPGHRCGKRGQVPEGIRLRLSIEVIKAIAPIATGLQPDIGRRLRLLCRQVGHAGKPACVVVLPHKGQKQAQRHPFVPVGVALMPFASQPLLERLARLAQIVQQGGELGQQHNVFARLPVVFVLGAQHIAAGGIGGHGALGVESAAVAHDPEQLAVVQPPDPVAGHGRVPAGALPQQAPQGIEPRLGHDRLPGALAPPLGELVQNAPRLAQGTLVALRNQQHIHGNGSPPSVERAGGATVVEPASRA